MDAAWLDVIGSKTSAGRAREAAASRPGMRVLEAGGALIRVRAGGEKSRSVVLVPDPPNVIEHYDRLFEKLTPHLRVVCFELPGFGFSVPPQGFGFSLGEYAEIAGEVLRELDLADAVWAASCLPAYVGFALAARDPSPITGLILGQAPSWEEALRWMRRLDNRGLLTTPFVGQLVVHLLKRRVAAGWYEVAATPAARGWLKDQGLAALKSGATYSLASVLQASSGDVAPVAPSGLPSIFVWGPLDRTHRKTDASSSLSLIGHARCVVFENTAHFPDLEDPDRFAGLIRDMASAAPGEETR